MYNVYERLPIGECVGTVILLPGRGQHTQDMLRSYDQYSNLDCMRLIGIGPIDEWYPAPNGANDQLDAIWGLKISVPELDFFIEKIEKEIGINRDKIALSGFSAGAVMAIQLAALTKSKFAAVISHNGAILDPRSLPQSSNDTPIFLIHNKNDDCFSWDERYIPMKDSLLKNGYKLEFIESEEGDHYMHQEDVENAGIWLRKVFNF